MYKYDMKELTAIAKNMLIERGIELEKIADVVYELQKPYNEYVTHELCLESIERILEKREVVHVILTGFQLDKLANEKKLDEPLQSIVEADEGLYGIDEILPLGITNLYGSIGLTNFGYLDKEKLGIIKELDERKKTGKEVTTFADDIVAAIAAAAASRVAHMNIQKSKESWENT